MSSTDNTGALWDDIKAIWLANGYLIVSQYTAGFNHLKKIKLYDASSTVYTNSGYVISKVDDFGVYEVPKTIKQVLL